MRLFYAIGKVCAIMRTAEIKLYRECSKGRNGKQRKKLEGLVVKIAMGNDHGGTELKWVIKKYLESKGHEILNMGTDIAESCDYPVYAKKVADAVVAKKVDCGILICGTGVGISIAANKIRGIRAAVCSDTATARLVKQHNNANILAFGARIVGVELAKDICDAYLNAEFEGGGRHSRRISMIHELEEQ